MPATNHITQERLKEVLHYNPETGCFTWIKRTKGINKGSRAGCLHVSNKTGYRHIVIRIDRQLYKAHRLAFLYMTGGWPEQEVDHEDHDGTNNRWKNLRDVTHIKNHQNITKQSNNTSGVMGVCWHKTYGNWTARIRVNKKNKFLGCYKEKEDAIQARMNAEIKYGFHANHGK